MLISSCIVGCFFSAFDIIFHYKPGRVRAFFSWIDMPSGKGGTNMSLEGFGSRLKAVRQDRGYTQKQLAAALGVTEQAVSKWERKGSYPDILMLDGLSRVLDCSLDFLFQVEAGRKNLLNQK